MPDILLDAWIALATARCYNRLCMAVDEDRQVDISGCKKERLAVVQVRKLSVSLFALCLWAGAVAAADFNTPVRIGTTLGDVGDATLAVDRAGNPCVVFSAEQKIYFASGHDGFHSPRMVGSVSQLGLQDRPSVDTDGSGVTYVAFREKGAADVPEVAWTNNMGGIFKNPVAVPESTGEGVEQPTITVTQAGSVLIGWSVGLVEGDGDIFVFNSNLAEPPRRVLSGSEASFAIDLNGIVHVAYIRGGDLYYSNDKNGDFAANEVRFTNSAAREFSPSLAVTGSGTPVVMYLSENNGVTALYLGDGTFRELLVANVTMPRCGAIVVDDKNIYHAAFVVSGAVWTQRGIVGVMRQRTKVCDLQGGEQLVDLAVDQSAYVHLVLVRTGALIYMNNAPAPVAAFDVSAAEGIVPFTVAFDDQSTGHILQYYWDFGDGESSLDPEPEHTFRRQGTYTVSLRVTGTAGVTSDLVKTQFIKVLPKRDHMYIQDAFVYAGQKGVLIPVKVTNEQDSQGFQVAGRFDPSVVTLVQGLLPGDLSVDFKSTVASAQKPEFVAGKLNNEEGWFTLGVVFDLEPPITGNVVPGRKMNLVNLVADFSGAVPNRTDCKLRLEDNVGDPVINNILTVKGGVSVSPELHNGTVLVIRPDIEFVGPLFLRGDADGNSTINIADAIFILQYLFARGRPPACMDSADVDDSSQVNIADAISTLSYLFGNSFAPAYPFPDKGLDGTPDLLPACK